MVCRLLRPDGAEAFLGQGYRGDSQAELVVYLDGFSGSDRAVGHAEFEHLFARFLELDDGAGHQFHDLAQRLPFLSQIDHYGNFYPQKAASVVWQLVESWLSINRFG